MSHFLSFTIKFMSGLAKRTLSLCCKFLGWNLEKYHLQTVLLILGFGTLGKGVCMNKCLLV